MYKNQQVIPTILLSYFYGMIAKTVLENAKIKKRMQKNPTNGQISATKGEFVKL